MTVTYTGRNIEETLGWARIYAMWKRRYGSEKPFSNKRAESFKRMNAAMTRLEYWAGGVP
jgi:hypothetical protein